MRESDLVAELARMAPQPPAFVRVGPGDDAAVLAGGTVLSCDLTVEGVHYDARWLSPEETGFRATAAALSDLAAMAAKPIGVLASFALPGDAGRAAGLARAFQRGAVGAAARAGASILGGDASRTSGPAVLDIVACGLANSPALRSGAREGDDLWVSGPLGGAAAAVRAWKSGGEPTAAAARRFRAPPDRTGFALKLSSTCALSAMIDLSDGLAPALDQLAKASGAGMRIEAARVPVDQEADARLRDALFGGEDYELLFSAPGALRRLIGSLSPEASPSRIGKVAGGQGVRILRRRGRAEPLAASGFDHFGAQEE